MLVVTPLHSNYVSGLLAEQFVAQHLEALGATVLAQRWRCAAGEIDLVVRLEECLCFIEVKARGRVNLDSDGLEAINRHKRQRICRAAKLFLLKNPHLNGLGCRFDVALVRKNPRAGPQLLAYLSGAFVEE